VLVSGLVQGVGFRWYTREHALSLGLRGWVHNLPDGRVEAKLEGEPSAVRAMLGWLRKGPAHAQVDGIEVRPDEPEGLESFEVERTRWQ